MGKADNWKDILYFNNTLTEEGRWGFQDIVLNDSENQPDAATDLLIHFNASPLKDESGHYTFIGTAPVISKNTWRLGRASCAFQGKRDEKELVPGENALFRPGALWNDFSIEFWIYPAILANGESLICWNGSFVTTAKIIKQQSINCLINQRRLTWDFDNFFLSTSGAETHFLLTGLTAMLPRKWYHHLVRFDSNTGLLEYLVNGEIEAVLYTTETGREGSSVYLPLTGSRTTGNLILGRDFTGFMDELYISRKFINKPLIRKYDNPVGSIVSRIIDFEYSGTVVKRIDAVFDKPGNSEIYFFYKMDNELYTRDELKPDWIQFLPGTELNAGVKGQYFQLKIEFYADGARSVSPSLSSLEIVYEPDLPPLPPPELIAVPGNGQVRLQWKKVNEYDIAGYLVYYGEFPGAYNGENASEGASPVDAGNTGQFLLTNLENGKVYYFAVVAYDSAKPQHRSVFSREVSARPSVLYQ